MSTPPSRADLIAAWLNRADQALASADLELRAGHLSFTVNRLYYACFYAVSGLLLTEGRQYARHSAVVAEFNRSWV